MKCAVLISLYNAEKTLDKTFESLKTQTTQDFRVIAIDDCSQDSTLTLLRKWEQLFGKNRFLILRNEHNIGLTKSLNKGLNQITEFYTARIDADDCWHPEKLAKQICYLESHSECGVLGTQYENVSLKKSIRVALPETNQEIRHSIFKRNPFAHSCVIFQTAIAIESGGYDENIRYGQDYDLWFRLLPKTSFANLPEFLCSRSIEGTLTSGGKNQRKQMLQCVKTQLKYLKIHNQSILKYRFIIEPLLVAITPESIRILKRRFF